MGELSSLPNLGAASLGMLHAAGIDSLQQLRKLGAIQAYRQVKAAGLKPSLNLSWALKRALTGRHWQDVARDDRLSLLLALEQHP